MSDPHDNVPDQLEERLEGLSATLTDDDVTTEYGDRSGTWELGQVDTDDTDTDTDTDDTDQDADADDPSV